MKHSLRSLLLSSSLLLLTGQSAPTPPNPVAPITAPGPVWTTGWLSAWHSKMDASKDDVLLASSFGVVGDAVLGAGGNTVTSGTDNTVSLNAAINYCASKGTKLQLPPGLIWIKGSGTYGSITTILKNCGIFGSSVSAYSVPYETTSGGTTLLFTNTTVKPFEAHSSWSFTGINFYWPLQTTGTTAYPPLISDDGVNGISRAYLDHVVIVNAYDAIVETPGIGWSDMMFSNSSIMATRDLFSLSDTKGSFVLSNLIMGPGPWFTVCPTCKTTGGNNSAANSTIIHVTAGSGVTISAVNMNAFAWRYAIRIDSGGVFGNSIVSLNLDGVGTVIDASSGGQYVLQNKLSGFQSNCGVVTWSPDSVNNGNAPCFNMGANSNLILDGWNGGPSQGSYIVLSGGFVRVKNSIFGGVGKVADGSDYYAIHIAPGSGVSEVRVENSELSGNPSDAHVHGIVSDSTVMGNLVVQNSSFSLFNEDIQAPYASLTQITGNSSIGTTGTVSFSLSGSGAATISGNLFDKQPHATVASCGTAPSVQGSMQGRITLGSGSPSACTLTLPYNPTGGAGDGSCVFGGGTSDNGTGSPPAWVITLTGADVTYRCGSE